MHPVTLVLRGIHERSFWNEGSVKAFYMTIDALFWIICLMNGVIDWLTFGGVIRSSWRVPLLALLLMYLTIALATSWWVMVAPHTYYQHRCYVMVLNRGLRLLLANLAVRTTEDPVEMSLDFAKRYLARGRSDLLVVSYICLRATASNLPQTLYFPLPFRYAIIWDVLEQLFRLIIYVPWCVAILSAVQFDSARRQVCGTVNSIVGNLYSLYTSSSLRRTMAAMEEGCERHDAMLLALYTWWTVGFVGPTFTVWYIEFCLKQHYMDRVGLRRGELLTRLELFLFYLLCLTLVGCASWLAMHELVAAQGSRQLLEAILRAPKTPRG